MCTANALSLLPQMMHEKIKVLPHPSESSRKNNVTVISEAG
jgi:hypothetical protein